MRPARGNLPTRGHCRKPYDRSVAQRRSLPVGAGIGDGGDHRARGNDAGRMCHRLARVPLVLRIHASTDISALAGRLGKLWAEPPSDVFAPEWLAVPSEGIRRWLFLELARVLGATEGRRDGIVANVNKNFAGSLRQTVIASARGEEVEDRWAIERLAWSLMALAEERSDDPLLAPFLRRSTSDSRYARARRVADLFDGYHQRRPGMIRSWHDGRDVDGVGNRLPAEFRWQAHLWRLARQRLGQESPPELWPRLVGDLRSGRVEPELPERLVFFGFETIPSGQFLELAEALRPDVHFFLVAPTRISGEKFHEWAPLPAGGRRLRTQEEWSSHIEPPLLRSWGRQSRETGLLLADSTPGQVTAWLPPEVGSGPSTLLKRLQTDLEDRRSTKADFPLKPDDHSVQFHTCFGATRQAEVVRDVILHLLQDSDGALREDDILVVTPDIRRFAPVIEAVWGSTAPGTRFAVTTPDAEEDDAPALRYRINDQDVKDEDPVMAAISALLGLLGSRFDVNALLEFLALPPVSRQLELSDDDLATVVEWARELEVRWGLDGHHRKRFGLAEQLRANSWAFGLDRLLMGAAVMDGDHVTVGGIAPFGIEGSDVEMAGRIAEAIGRLAEFVQFAEQDHPVDEWIDSLSALVGAVIGTGEARANSGQAVDELFASIRSAASFEPAAPPASFVDVVKLVNERLDGQSGGFGFFRGGVTVTSLKSLPWVPFRVVCLLGMDEASLAVSSGSGDDLVAATPLFGDPDPRASLRANCLAAVLSARDVLVVVRDGRDVRTNQEVPQAVIPSELFDACSSLVEADDPSTVRRRLERVHPRQAYARSNFLPEEGPGGKVWSFSRRDQRGAEARRNSKVWPEDLVGEPLPPDKSNVIELDELQSFLRNPVAWFFRHRLGVRLPQESEPLTGLLPVAPTGLEKWKVGQRLLEARLHGRSTEEWWEHEQALGSLPPGRLGRELKGTFTATVDAIVGEADRLGYDAARVVAQRVDVELADGTRVVGSVEVSGPDGRHCIVPTFSRLRPKNKLGAWLSFVALVADDPSSTWSTTVIGRHEDANSKFAATSYAFTTEGEGPDRWRETAREALENMVGWYRQGLREPVPFFPKTSWALVADQAMEGDWNGGGSQVGERNGPGMELAFASTDLLDMRRRPVPSGDPGDPGQPGYMDHVANAIWGAFNGFDGVAQDLSPVPTPAPPSDPDVSGGAG